MRAHRDLPEAHVADICCVIVLKTVIGVQVPLPIPDAVTVTVTTWHEAAVVTVTVLGIIVDPLLVTCVEAIVTVL